MSITADSMSGVAPFPVSFVGNVLDPEGGALTYAWDFDSNGTTDATTKDATHVYTAVGTYTATLTATDAGGKHQKATIRIDATTAVATCPGDDDFLGTSLNTSRWTVTREDPTAMNVSGGSLNITSQNFDIHGGGDRAAQHRAPAAADVGGVDGDDQGQLGSDDELQQRRPDGLRRRRQLHQGRHGLERRSASFEAFKELNNTATALGLGDGEHAGDVPDHVVPAADLERHDDPAGVLARTGSRGPTTAPRRT